MYRTTSNHIFSTTAFALVKRKKHAPERHYTNSDIIDETIEKELVSLTILPEFRKWALAVLAEHNDKEISDRTKIYESQQKVLNDAQKQLDNLTQMRLKDMIDDEEYAKEKTRLKNEISIMHAKMKGTEQRADNWLKLTEDTFDFACYAHKAFLFGDSQTKREILSTVASLNPTLKNHLFSIKAVEWLAPIKECYPAIEAKMKAFEPEKYGSIEWEKEAFASLIPEVRSRRDLNSQPPA